MNLNAVFDFVLTSTVNGSIVGFIVFLIRKLADKILPHKYKVLLWAVFIIKLVFPFGPKSKVSVFNLPHFQGEFNIPEVFLENTGSVPVAQVKTVDIIPYIWLLGLVITGAWLLFSNIIFSLRLKALSKPVDERTDKIFSQCKDKLNVKRDIGLVNQPIIKGVSLFGLLRPKILITNKLTSFTDREIEYIFYHELSHYTRRDIFTNFLISIIQTMHWFNPLIHIFAKAIRQDIELATDEKTLSLIGNGEHRAYGRTLVSMLEEYSRAYSPKLLGASDGKRHIKKRIMQISHYRKKGKYSVCLFSVLAIALSFATLTTAVPVKSTSIPQVNIKFIKKAEQKEAPLVTQKTEEIEKEVPSSVPKKEQAPAVSEKETVDLNVPIPAESILFPEAKVNALPPGTDFDMMLSKALNSGRSREASQNINLNSSCSVREFNLKENSSLSLGNYTPDYNGNISLYINSSSSQRLNIILLKDGKALLNASVKPSKTSSYSFTGLDNNDGYELLLTYKADNEYNNTDISGTVLIY